MEATDWDGLCKNYHQEIVSPLHKEVKNPLLSTLQQIKDAKSKVVADIGCGRGEILDLLAEQFKTVHALDFSPAMITMAQQNATKENIEFAVRDMRSLRFRQRFDVAVAVNSVIMPRISDVNQALRSIYSSLKKGGEFYAIFPSMDTILYQGFLILEQQIRRHKDEQKALQHTKRLMERKRYNFLRGTFNDNGQRQKFYYDFELNIRLQDAGFKDIRLAKVLYPWGPNFASSRYFKNRPPMWDWFVSARKP